MAVVSAAGVLTTPPFERALAGTTVRRAMELARAAAARRGGPEANPLGRLLTGVAQQRLSLADAAAAREVFLLAGDTHVFAVTTLDGKAVGDGRVGPVATALGSLLHDDAAHGSAHHSEPLG